MTSTDEAQNYGFAAKVEQQCPVIITSRLYIRPALYRDATALTEILKDPEVSGKVAIFRQPYQHEDSVNLCRLSEENSDGSKGWFMSIFLRGTDQQVGYVLLPFDAPGSGGFLMKPGSPGAENRALPKSGEVGYWLGKDYWGQGYASEALAALLSVAFDYLPLDYVHASTATYNAASKNVLLRHGFVQDLEVFMRATVTGENRPSNNFRLTAEQWGQRILRCAQRPSEKNNANASLLQHEAK